MTLAEAVDQLEQLLGTALPAGYRAFLLSHDGSLAYAHGHEYWRLRPAVEQGKIKGLLSEIEVNQWRGPLLRLLEGYALELREFVGPATRDEKGKPFDLDRLSRGIAIGADNTDAVFLDPSSDYSVWCFHPDGGDVKKLADSFDLWFSKLEPEEDF